MILYLIFLIILIVWKGKVLRWNEDYHTRNQTTSVKGIFIFLVFLSHLRSYVSCTDFSAFLYDTILDKIGQLMVAMFFFYSGYGVFYSWTQKENYLKGFVRNRILKTLLHFDIALLFYLLINFVIKADYSKSDYLLCWIGWNSIGNSNWYIFVILCAYCLSYLSFINHYINTKTGKIILISVYTCLLIGVLRILGKEPWWYNTVLCYPLGAAFSLYRTKIEEYIKKTSIWLISLICFIVFFEVTYLIGGIFYLLCNLFFCCIVVLITTKYRINNKLLLYLGDNLFEIYILQRIPMIIITNYLDWNAFVVAGVSWIITLILSYIYVLLMKKVDSYLFR